MSRLIITGVILLAALLIVGAVAPAAAPLTLTSPDSGSMEPTIPEHSLAVVVDKQPQVGDIALYTTPARDSPVLHRLVGTTDDGTAYLTQGDANEVTDQELGDPAVTDTDIHGVIPTIAGTPLAIPYAGLIFSNPVFVIGAWAALGLSLLYTTNPGRVIRGTVVSYPAHLYAYALATLVFVLLPVVTLTTPAIVEAQLLTSTTASADASHIATPGETTTHTVTVSSQLMAVMHTSAHATGDLTVTAVESTLGSPRTEITVTNTPSESPTAHHGVIAVYAYPPILPESVLHGLAAIHPVVAATVTGAILSFPIALLGAIIDSKRLIRASRRGIYRFRRNSKRLRDFNDP